MVSASHPKISKHPHDIYGERYHAGKNKLTPRLLKIAEYIHYNRRAVLEQTALEIAAETSSSDASVIRTIQSLGFSGLRELKTVIGIHSGTQKRSAKRVAATVNKLSQDSRGCIDYVVNSYQRSCEMLSSVKNKQAITDSLDLLQRSDRIAIFGIGAAALLADYSCRLFRRNGSDAYVLNRTGISLSEQIAEMRRNDILLMLVQGSAHREGVVTITEARRLGIKIIVLTGETDSLFARRADIVIEIPRGVSTESMPVHATPMICLEILTLGLAARTPVATMSNMEKLYEISRALRSDAAVKKSDPSAAGNPTGKS